MSDKSPTTVFQWTGVAPIGDTGLLGSSEGEWISLGLVGGAAPVLALRRTTAPALIEWLLCETASDQDALDDPAPEPS